MEYIGEALALGLDSIIFGICCRLYLKNRNAVHAIENAQTVNIDAKLQEVVNSSPDHKLKYVILRGTVKALGSPIQSINTPDVKGVIQRLSVKEHIITRTSAGFWSEQERTIQEVYNCVPFALRAGRTEVEVVDALASDILDLDTIADRFEPSSLGAMDHIWGFFMGIRQRGLQSTEEIMREGALVTGIGELTVANAETLSGLKLQPPTDGTPYYLTSLPVSSIVRRLDVQKRSYWVLTVVFGGVGVFLLALLTKRWWNDRTRLKHEAENRRRLEENRKQRRRQVRDDNLPQSQLCVVCRQNPREMILLPCGHVCLCEDCTEGINNYCPVCRASIQNKAAAYLV